MIPQERLNHFQEILRVVRWTFPGSDPVIGGGALRDAYFGRAIKDVDVFLRARDFTTLDSVYTTRIQCPPFLLTYGRRDMFGAWDFNHTIAGYPVQLVLAEFNNKIDLAHTFDIGLSRVTYDGGVVYFTEEFLEDSLQRLLNIRRADNHHEFRRSLRRVERLRGKYPEFSEADPHLATVGHPRCPMCRDVILPGAFRNEISVREFYFSGLCQKCQDSMFGPD